MNKSNCVTGVTNCNKNHGNHHLDEGTQVHIFTKDQQRWKHRCTSLISVTLGAVVQHVVPRKHSYALWSSLAMRRPAFWWILCYGNASSPAPNRTNMASALKDKPFLQKLWAPTDLIYGLPLRLRIWHLAAFMLQKSGQKIHHLWRRLFFIPKPEHQFVFEILQDIKKFKAMHYWTEWLLQNSTSTEFLGVAAKKHLPNSTQKSSPETQITLV